MRMTIYLFYLLFGYLSGSVLYSYLIPKHFCHVDVRTANDQNPGAFNAFSAAGPARRTVLRSVRYWEGLSAGVSGSTQLCGFDGFVAFCFDSARPGGGSCMAVSAAGERRKGDLCLVRRTARSPAGPAAGASAGCILPYLFADSDYPAAQSALNCFLRRLRCRRSAFPLSAVRTARKSARVTCRLLPPLFQLPTVRIRKCFIYNSVSVC